MHHSSSGSPNKGKQQQRRIHFANGENKVVYVRPPPKALNPELWFKESDALVTKPMIFTLDPFPAKVNVAIDTSVRILSFGPVFDSNTGSPVTGEEEEDEDGEEDEVVVINGKPVSKKNSSKTKLVSSTPAVAATGVCRMSLEVKQRDMIDELGMAPKFKMNPDFALGGKRGRQSEEPYNPSGKFFSVGSCSFSHEGASAANVGSGRIGVKLPQGQYELRNSCKDAKMVVYAQAVDVVRRLM